MAKKQVKKKVSELEKLNQDLLDLRLKHASMALKETHKISEMKKDIALSLIHISEPTRRI